MKQHIKNNTKFNKNNKNYNNNKKQSISNKKLFKPKTYKEKPKQSVQENIEIKDLQSKYDSIDPKCINLFSDFPLSKKTQKGLKQCDYKIPTDIQKESIGYALKGNDVLGAAITGSGKTLAFLIPIMETLFTKKWSRVDGVGAIIISPTRELAYQIFETLRKIGNEHDFSAGLIIGGKNLKYERRRMDQCNIVICTPGRLLQHMDENPLFNCSTMQILVLDEADRCLDMGFSETMNGIIENLPPERQTLLFSATQTNSVKDLARLSLKNPIYIAPHEQSEFSTPVKLQQNYVIVNLEDKVTMLWSFLKNHLKQKCIIFLASCKQVKYIYEIFCKLRPGISLLALYGTLHQERRMAIYNEFCRKSNVVLFATDIASRGLDFPTVNWVIQFDCPEDATAYIHRAGRTARHQENGENLLILMPNEEEPMVKELKERKIPIEKIFIDSKRLFSPKAKIEAFLAQNQQLKESAQRAFVAYIKSVVLMKNKQCFNVKALDLDAYARSLGLIVTPRIRFLQRLKKAQQKNYLKQTGANNKEGKDDDDDNDADGDDDDGDDDDVNDDDSGDNDDHNEDISDEDKNNKLPNNNEYINFNNETSSDDDNDDLITIKRRNHEILEDQLPEVPSLNEIKTAKKPKKSLTKAAIAKRILKKKITVNKRIIYNDDGEVIIDTAKQLQSELAKEYGQSTEGGINIEKAKELLREEDKFDKKRFQQLVKAKHKEMKKKAKSQSNKQDEFDEFGSDADSGPDLSWLPDPDKMYDKQSKELDKNTNFQRDVVNSDSDSNLSSDEENYNNKQNNQRKVVNSDSDSEDSDDVKIKDEKIHKPSKKLLKSKSSKRKYSQQEGEEEEDDESIVTTSNKKTKKFASQLSINEAEMLAMKLLEKN